VCGLRVTVPWWRRSGGRSGLQRAATSVWHSVGDNGADVDGLFLTPLPSGGGVMFCVGAFVCVRGFVCAVVSASRVMYQCFFLLNDIAVLLFLFKKYWKFCLSCATVEFATVRCRQQYFTRETATKRLGEPPLRPKSNPYLGASFAGPKLNVDFLRRNMSPYSTCSPKSHLHKVANIPEDIYYI
jgi:hypothetical protein